MPKLSLPPEEVSFDAAKLYPELSPDEQREAAYFLDRYLDIVCRIYERTSHLTDGD